MFSCDFELLTERLAIRCVQPARASELSALVTANQAHLVEWMPWAVNVMSADEYGTFLAERCALFESGTDMAMHLIERSSERLVGGIGLHFIDWDNGVVEIGYWLSKESCGAGLVTEAVRRLVAFVFGELSPVERVEIRCDAENLLSGAVALRCGFAHEATLRSNRRNHTGRREMRDTKRADLCIVDAKGDAESAGHKLKRFVRWRYNKQTREVASEHDAISAFKPIGVVAARDVAAAELDEALDVWLSSFASTDEQRRQVVYNKRPIAWTSSERMRTNAADVIIVRAVDASSVRQIKFVD